MTDYHHDHVVVYAALGGSLRLASTLRAFVTDTITGDPVNVTQGAVTAAYVDVDTDGRATFTATTPNRLRLTSGATFIDVWPIEVSGPSDVTVAGLVGTASATRTALDGRYIPLFADPGADRILFWDDSAGAVAALAPSTGLVISGTNMTVRDASETQTGIVELATSAETITGTDTTRATTPAGVKAAAAPGAWTAPTLLNSWADFGSGYRTTAYRKTPTGDVELRGMVKSGTGVVFTLPTGHRPSAIELFGIAAAAGSAQVNIATSGDITVINYAAGGSNANVCLNGLKFSTL